MSAPLHLVPALPEWLVEVRTCSHSPHCFDAQCHVANDPFSQWREKGDIRVSYGQKVIYVKGQWTVDTHCSYTILLIFFSVPQLVQVIVT